MKNLRDILLDGDNREPIVLSDFRGQRVVFEQVAVIPIFLDGLYCVLKPITPIEGVAEDEAIVFRCEDDGDEPTLKVVTDEMKALKVFDEYYQLLEDSLGTDDDEE